MADPVRIGLMGLGQIGRQLYHLAAASEDLQIVAVSDIGAPEVLHYLLSTDSGQASSCELRGNYLVNDKFQTRMMQADRPGEVPWDVFDVDIVVDATNRFKTPAHMQAHLDGGAPRVLISQLPEEMIDRVVLMGMNDASIRREDRMISAGSATTAALALALKVIDDAIGVVSASMTTVHAYSSDQSLQDYAGRDFRRSRSAAENIIPNSNDSAHWVAQVLPQFAGKLLGFALNVPVQKGNLLDLDIVLADETAGIDEVNAAMVAAVDRYPGLLEVATDPIVSSDVIGNPCSLLFDLQGTIKAGRHIVKLLGWYESLGHAARLLDVVRLYTELDASAGGGS
ncbi:MAG: glyceraldehyde-3-phosphate dehydrogenase [Gammaproteobacteria bacterium]|nr:glyceraldehyde-3-phosphate dehydrogenase [Gammaproteobacteria bacterium]